MRRYVGFGTSTLFLFLSMLCTAVGAQPVETPAQSEDQIEEEWIRMKAEQGDSHASGMRPELGPVSLGNPTQAVVTLRVGLYYSFNATGGYSEFNNLNHPFVDVTHTAGDVHIIDRSTGKQITAIPAGPLTRVSYSAAGYTVAIDSVPLGTFQGPIFFRPTAADNQFRIDSIRRVNATTKPLYRGAIEVARGTRTQADRVNLVNVVELEDYVPGVVTNESIASWNIEALKSQAVAARGYAVSNIGRYSRLFGDPFDIVDSSASQVYRGVVSEHVKAVQAARETIGLVGSYDGRIIEALYSSSMGGHTENNEWIFNSPSSQLPGTNISPYLRAIYDGDGVPPDFGTAQGVADFWTVRQPATFDDCLRVNNRLSRWRFVYTAAQIKSRLTPSRVTVLWGTTDGAITNIEITERMPSGRAATVVVTYTTGQAQVRGWTNLRAIFGTPFVSTAPICGPTTGIGAGTAVNSPSVIGLTADAAGVVTQVTALGGGFGHNVGMSQYGMQGRALAGQNFLQILKAYYTGIDVGSYPIDIGREPGSGPPTLRQQFMAPNARGTLVIRPTDLKGLRVHVNETYDLSFDEAALSSGVVTVDLAPYLLPGLNTIQFNPVGRNGKATVLVAIE